MPKNKLDKPCNCDRKVTISIKIRVLYFEAGFRGRNWIEQSVIRRHEMMIRRRLLRQRIHRRLHRYRGRRKSGGRRRKAVRGRQVRVEVAVSFDARQVGPRDTAINNVELIK